MMMYIYVMYNKALYTLVADLEMVTYSKKLK